MHLTINAWKNGKKVIFSKTKPNKTATFLHRYDAGINDDLLKAAKIDKQDFLVAADKAGVLAGNRGDWKPEKRVKEK